MISAHIRNAAMNLGSIIHELTDEQAAVIRKVRQSLGDCAEDIAALESHAYLGPCECQSQRNKEQSA